MTARLSRSFDWADLSTSSTNQQPQPPQQQPPPPPTNTLPPTCSTPRRPPSSSSALLVSTEERLKATLGFLPSGGKARPPSSLVTGAQRRRRFFATKGTANSAPSSLIDTRRLCGVCREPLSNCLDVVLRATRRERDTSTITPPSVEVWESEIAGARSGDVAVTHVSELDFPDADPPCHFCCEQASTAIHDESRLQIVSGGLVRSRDGSTRSGSAPYINLPSPNVQADGGEGPMFGTLSPSLSTNLLSPGSHHHHHHQIYTGLPCQHSRAPSLAPSISSSIFGGGGGGAPPLLPPTNMSSTKLEESSQQPPASSLTRRPALVPPKLMAEREYEERGGSVGSGGCRGRWSSDDATLSSARRSSIVVIPPMQICPGDLLVYGKVLTQRKSLLGTPIDSPMAPIFDAESGRKTKASWSLLRLFERGGRGSKGGGSGTLEEVMGLLAPSEFADPKLTRFKGMVWVDFVAHVANHRTKKSGSVASSGSSDPPSTSPSLSEIAITEKPLPLPLPLPPPSPTKVPAKPLVRKRMGLMRTMSDRCLERRITPALLRGTQGFLMNEKLVEGKETPSCSSSGGGASCGGGGEEEKKEGGGGGEEGGRVVLGEEERQKVRQREALWDLFQSEVSFLYDHLMVLKNVFMEPLKRIQVEGYAMYAEPELLFGNLDELCAVTYAFCKEASHLLLTLTTPSGDLHTTDVLAKLFEPSSKARAVSQAYHRYALNYINALNYLETLRRHSEFTDFEKLCMKDPRCKKLQLTDLLVSPVQHLMKVPLILKDIAGRTEEPQEKELIAAILDIQEASIRELDDKMRWLKNFERLLEIQRNIIWPSVLEMEPKTWVPEFLRVALARQPCDSIVVSPRRQIIHEGLLTLWDTGKPSECYVILFDDMLLITRRKKGLSKKKSSLTENWQSACGKSVSSGEPNHRYIVYRQPISLDRFFIHDIGEGEGGSTKLEATFVLVSLNRFQQIIAVHTLQAPADAIKATWLSKLKSTQDKWKRTLQTTVFRGVRSSTDSGQSNVASNLLQGLSSGGSRPFLTRGNTADSSN